MFLWSSVPTVLLYPLFHWSSVPIVPLVRSAHCSSGSFCSLFTDPLFLIFHSTTNSLCPLFTGPLYPLTLPFCYTYLLIISYFRTRCTRDYPRTRYMRDYLEPGMTPNVKVKEKCRQYFLNFFFFFFN